MLLDNGADDLEREPFGRRIHRQHPSFSCPALVVAEVDEFPRLKLAAVEEAHGTGDEQRVAL